MMNKSVRKDKGHGPIIHRVAYPEPKSPAKFIFDKDGQVMACYVDVIETKIELKTIYRIDIPEGANIDIGDLEDQDATRKPQSKLTE